jgi:hypothetical protein
MQPWRPRRELHLMWENVPDETLDAFRRKCGEACPSLRRVNVIDGPTLERRGGQWGIGPLGSARLS